MKLRKRLLILAILLPGAVVFAGGDTELYQQAQSSVRRGNVDFAYMQMRNILRDYPKSRYREQAMFGMGEYHYLIPQYKQAEAMFNQYLDNFSDSKGTLFALCLLHQIAEFESDAAKAADLKNRIIKYKQVSLIFREYQEYKFVSPLNRTYRAVFHIDRIDFFAGDKPLATISY
jgi:outer membrane protein assembly factor BamD (BamD/ComL family)